MNSRSFLEYKDEPKLEGCFYIRNRDERIEKRVSEKNAFNKFQEGGGGIV